MGRTFWTQLGRWRIDSRVDWKLRVAQGALGILIIHGVIKILCHYQMRRIGFMGEV